MHFNADADADADTDAQDGGTLAQPDCKWIWSRDGEGLLGKPHEVFLNLKSSRFIKISQKYECAISHWSAHKTMILLANNLTGGWLSGSDCHLPWTACSSRLV